jgi:lysophospholipase L1-like esterase
MGNYSYQGRNKPYVYVPEGSLDGYFAKMDNHRRGPVSVMAFGDSLTQGQAYIGYSVGDFDWRIESWPYVLQNRLLGDLPTLEQCAEYFSMGEGQDYNANYRSPGFGTGGEAWTAVGVSQGFQSNGWFFGPTWATVNTWSGIGSELLKFTAPSGTVRLDEFRHNPFGTPPYSFKRNVNGVPGDAKDTTISIAATSAIPTRETIWTGAPSRPVVRYGNQSASGALFPLGMNAYYKNEAVGLMLGRMAFTGKTMGDFTRLAGFPTDKPAEFFQDVNGMGFPCGADLAIMALGVNDCNRTNLNALRPEEYEAALVRCIEAGRRRDPNASFVLVAMHYPPDVYGEVVAFANNMGWSAYVDVMQAVARRKVCAFVNFSDYVGSQNITSAALGAGDGHLTRTGHKMLGNMVADAVGVG